MKVAMKVTQGIAVLIAAFICSALTFFTIDLGTDLYGWQTGLFLEVVFIGTGMYFFWEFRRYFIRKLHL